MKELHCPHCGRTLATKARLCPHCGGAVGDGGDKKYAGAGRPWRDMVIVLAFVVLFSVGFFLFKEQGQRPSAPERQVSLGHGIGVPASLMDNLPTDYYSLVNMGNQYMDEGNALIAAELYRRALVLDSSSADVRADYGACLYASGMPERAIEEFRKVIELSPNHVIAHYNLGLVYRETGQSDSARYYLERYLTLEPAGAGAEKAQAFLKDLTD